MIVIPIALCPHCGGDDHERVRTCDNGDGTTTRRVLCRNCGERFKILLELPEAGSDVIWPEYTSPP